MGRRKNLCCSRRAKPFTHSTWPVRGPQDVAPSAGNRKHVQELVAAWEARQLQLLLLLHLQLQQGIMNVMWIWPFSVCCVNTAYNLLYYSGMTKAKSWTLSEGKQWIKLLLLVISRPVFYGGKSCWRAEKQKKIFFCELISTKKSPTSVHNTKTIKGKVPYDFTEFHLFQVHSERGSGWEKGTR